MSFEALIGQQPAKTYLESVLRSGRMSHAYLFSGPSGVGKRTAAAAFAQIALCQQRPSPEQACSRCKSCHWFEGKAGAINEHPDVIPLMMVKERETSSDDNPEKGRNREEKLVDDHDPIIPLGAIQNACEQLHRSPMVGARRVLIVPEAQRLCRGQAESANAFLKTLEEPPRAALIILTTSQPEGLIETIISRVQTVQFRRLSQPEVLDGLRRSKPQLPAEEAGLVAALADGSIGRAIEFADGDLKSWREQINRALKGCDAKNWLGFGVQLWQLAQNEGERLYKQAEEIEESDEENADETDAAATRTEAGWVRYVLLRLLALSEITFRDGLVFAATEGSEDAPLLQPNDRALIGTIAQRFGAEGCQQALSALQDAAAAARLYVRGDICVRALAGRLRDAMA